MGALVLVAYAALLLDPSPLFAHTLRRGALIAHVDAPIPAALSETLDEATRRLSRSPLFDPARVHHLYFCQSEWRWRLFAHWNQGAAGFALAPFSRVVFLRRSQTDPASGHYLRYALLVAHELDVRGVRLEDLLTAPRASTLVERDVRRGE